MLRSIPFFSELLGMQLTDKRKSSNVHVLLYGAIDIHSRGPLGCIAGNDDLSATTGVTKGEIRRYLSEMKQGGWIDYELGVGNKRGAIKLMLKLAEPLRKNSTTLADKTHTPLRENSAITIDNNIDNSLENTSGGEDPPQEDPVVEEEVVITPCVFINKDSGLMCGKNCMKDLNKCSHHAVQEVIDLFKPVNESYLEFYGKKTQHAAVKSLLTTYKMLEIEWMIKTAPAYNKMPMRAAKEKIYTPHDLLKNWSIMKDNLISYKLQKQQGTKEVV